MMKVYGSTKSKYRFSGNPTDFRTNWNIYGNSFNEIWNTLVDIGVMHTDTAEELGFNFETNPPMEEDDFLKIMEADTGNAYYQSIYEKDENGKLWCVYSNHTPIDKYREEAQTVTNAIKKLANDTEALDEFESYLSRFFPTWLEKWASTPEGLAEELKRFSELNERE